MAPRSHRTGIALTLLAALIALPSLAQDPSNSTKPRAYAAAPDIYKIIAEGQQYRVLAVTLKPSQRTPEHHHPAATAIYFINDCTLKLTESGVDMDTGLSAGGAVFMNLATTHSAMNTGKSECKMVYFEPK